MTVNVENYFESPGIGRENRPFIAGLAVPTKVGFAFAPGAANIAEVTITLQDGKGNAIPSPVLFTTILSDSAVGLGLAAVAASGTVQAKSASGADIGVLTAKLALVSQTLADGSFVLEITDTNKRQVYIAVMTPFGGLLDVSRQILTADYGA